MSALSNVPRLVVQFSNVEAGTSKLLALADGVLEGFMAVVAVLALGALTLGAPPPRSNQWV